MHYVSLFLLPPTAAVPNSYQTDALLILAIAGTIVSVRVLFFLLRLPWISLVSPPLLVVDTLDIDDLVIFVPPLPLVLLLRPAVVYLLLVDV